MQLNMFISRLNFIMLFSMLLFSVCSFLPSHACSVYALNDKGLNLSQLLCINPTAQPAITLLDSYPTADLEALALDTDADTLYLLSSSDAKDFPVGELYRYQPDNGTLESIGNTGYDAIDSLAFCGTTLYGWARGSGLVKIDTTTAATQIVLPANEDVEGLTCDSEGVLYGVYGTQLLTYDGNNITLSCELPATAETIEILEQNSLLLGLHNESQILQLDLQSCDTVPYVKTKWYRDIEGLAVEMPTCLAFDNFVYGQVVAGKDKVYPGLTITGLDGGNLVVSAENKNPMLYGGSGTQNACLGKQGTGISDINHKHHYSFQFEKQVKYFSLWMHDYGDYNPNGATEHGVFLEGFDQTGQNVAVQKLRYRSPEGTNLDDNTTVKLGLAGDACDAQTGQIGNRMWQVSAPDMTEITLRFYNNKTGNRSSDPYLALSAICFLFDD